MKIKFLKIAAIIAVVAFLPLISCTEDIGTFPPLTGNIAVSGTFSDDGTLTASYSGPETGEIIWTWKLEGKIEKQGSGAGSNTFTPPKGGYLRVSASIQNYASKVTWLYVGTIPVPTENDFIIQCLEKNSVSAPTITGKNQTLNGGPNFSSAVITNIKYRKPDGTYDTSIPQESSSYQISFDVAANPGSWKAATINTTLLVAFESVSDFQTWLNNLPVTESPYKAGFKITDSDMPALKTAIEADTTKKISFIDFSISTITSIPQEQFEDYSSLTGIILPNSVTSINWSAFYGCSSLTGINIPNSVTSIGDWAFDGCTGLTSINIPNSVTSIGGLAFDGTAWYNNQPNGLVYAGKVAYKYKGTMPPNTNISLLEDTKGIAGDAFYNCSGLISVTIPDTVTSIGDWAFDGCTGLTSVNIPNSVTSIRRSFLCTKLISVTFAGDTIASLYSNAFLGDLYAKYTDSTNGGAGTYTRSGTGTTSDPYVWTKS